MTQPGELSRGWTVLFWTAALFNLLIGLAAMISPEASIDARTVGLLVFSFGVVYIQVARDPLRFGPVLWAGALGKLGVVGLLGPGAFGEGGSVLVAGGLLGDALFALGFLAFLFKTSEE
ncbi:MAG TPA: hypothetical protein DCS24_02520 [Erythrobacter sp.]|nr:hypothetical protein [Erythrobacter sp.]